jgi:outer membrane lipoprotein-sorting protein
MRYLKPFAAFLLFASATNVIAQDAKAKAILDELSNKTRKYASITSDFTFTLEDKAADLTQTQDGTLKMEGKKYYIKLGDNHIYSDGETRWTYNEEMNEVYIDHADAGEDALNPSEIFTVWETGFKHYYETEVTEGGKKYDLIKLNPTNPADKSFHTVKLFIDKSNMQVGKFLILGKQGDNYTYLVKTFKTDIDYSPSDFVFNAAKHPGVEEIDNR